MKRLVRIGLIIAGTLLGILIVAGTCLAIVLRNVETLPENIQERIIEEIDTGNLEAALRDLEKMERFAPVVNMAWVYGEKGYVLNQQKRHQEAIDALSKAIALDGSSPAYFNNRGLAYEKLHRFEEAEADFSTAIELQPDNYVRYRERSGFHWYAATVTGESRHIGEGLKNINQAIAMAPDAPESYWMRADLYALEPGHREAIITDLRKILELEAQGSNRDAAIRRLRVLGLEP